MASPMTLDDARAVLAHIAPHVLDGAIIRFMGSDHPGEFLEVLRRSMVEEFGKSDEYADVIAEAFLTVVKRTRAH